MAMVEYVGRNRLLVDMRYEEPVIGVLRIVAGFLSQTGNKSANTNPSRSTTSPACTSMGVRKHRCIVYERVKFAIFAAWIGSLGKSVQQAHVVLTTGKRLRNLDGSTQVILAFTPAAIMSRLSGPAGICPSGNSGSRPLPCNCRLR
jgi:hypothetical protein